MITKKFAPKLSAVLSDFPGPKGEGREVKKRIAALFTAAFTVLGLSIQHPAMAAAPQRYTPKSGGFTMTIPPGSTELYHTTTGVRFKVGEDFLISADLYTLPSFISVPMKQYSGEQKRELSKFLKKSKMIRIIRL